LATLDSSPCFACIASLSDSGFSKLLDLPTSALSGKSQNMLHRPFAMVCLLARRYARRFGIEAAAIKATGRQRSPGSKLVLNRIMSNYLSGRL